VIPADRLSSEQRSAVDASFDRCVAICGAPGTGKTTALLARAERARSLGNGSGVLLFPNSDRFDEYAVHVLALAECAVAIVDDVEAEATFEDACAPLFAMNWEEIVTEQLDPEVPGLRSPGRFLESAFRLIRKLRDARIGAQDFLSSALSGATEFYAKPPNFADPALLLSVNDTDRDALAVTTDELRRQYRREVDLAKILAKLYARYTELLTETGRMTGRDAIDAALERLRSDPDLARRLRIERPFAFVDDAEKLTAGELQLLQAVFGSNLEGVTLCGDAPAAADGPRFELHEQHRSPAAIEIACRRLITGEPLANAGAAPALSLFRATSPREEALFIAARVRAWLDAGTPANQIAVLFRSVSAVEIYETALLDLDVPVVVAGDVNLFAERRALDAIALLWNAYDPFRHDWLLRTLGNPAWGLSDASLATLCGEPSNPQTPLFVLDDEPAPTVRVGRWDPKRDLRLGWNVVRGDRDDDLPPDARLRVERFRTMRQGWLDAMHDWPFERFARAVWREGLAAEGAPGSARAKAQQVVLRRLLARLQTFLSEAPDRTVGDALEYAGRRASSDLESCEDPGDDASVRIASVEAVRGREFERVAIADVRAGAFPRWYVPDAFLFSPRYGMIPKENAGEARAARTAKFAYYMARNKVREKYNARERRAFVYALRRARGEVLVTASQPPTRGVAAPEFFEELRKAHLPGTRELERTEAS
jgi:superfamily I DNA/RNA helicase